MSSLVVICSSYVTCVYYISPMLAIHQLCSLYVHYMSHMPSCHMVPNCDNTREQVRYVRYILPVFIVCHSSSSYIISGMFAICHLFSSYITYIHHVSSHVTICSSYSIYVQHIICVWDMSTMLPMYTYCHMCLTYVHQM